MKAILIFSIVFAAWAARADIDLTLGEKSNVSFEHSLPRPLPDADYDGNHTSKPPSQHPTPMPQPQHPVPTHDQYFSYNFANVFVNTFAFNRFTLTNAGDAPLDLYNISLFGNGYMGRSYCPAMLPPGYRCIIDVQFEPWFPGPYSGRLNIDTNAGCIVVDLFGWGTQY